MTRIRWQGWLIIAAYGLFVFGVGKLIRALRHHEPQWRMSIRAGGGNGRLVAEFAGDCAGGPGRRVEGDGQAGASESLYEVLDQSDCAVAPIAVGDAPQFQCAGNETCSFTGSVNVEGGWR